MDSFGRTRDSGSLLPPRAGRALIAATWLVVAEGVVGSVPHRVGLHSVAAWIGAVVFLAAFPLVYARPAAATLIVSGIGAVIMAFTVSGNGPFIAVVATIAIAGVRLEPAYSRPIAALAGLGYIAAVITTGHISLQNVLSPASGLFFTYVAADSLRRLREEQRRTRALLQEVIAGRDDRIRAAALDERARLAREMHDVLAHTLSALSVQLEGARMLLEQRPGDPAAAAAVERASRLAREGLVEARRAVGSLRGDDLPGPDLLPQLVSDFERDTGIPAHLRVEGPARDLPPDARLAIYRVAQEALTNVRKHADAPSVDISLCYGENCAELTVENKGRERPTPMAGGGFGLTGMRERAELLGGRLEAGPTEDGFRVSLWLPL